MIIMQDLIQISLSALGFISLFVIPFLGILVRDIMKFVQIVEAAYKDGVIDVVELQQIMNQAGIILKRFFSFWMKIQPE